MHRLLSTVQTNGDHTHSIKFALLQFTLIAGHEINNYRYICTKQYKLI